MIILINKLRIIEKISKLKIGKLIIPTHVSYLLIFVSCETKNAYLWVYIDVYIICKLFFWRIRHLFTIFFQNMHLFIKIPKYAKICKIKLNVTETNLLLGLKYVGLKEKICKSHKHP